MNKIIIFSIVTIALLILVGCAQQAVQPVSPAPKESMSKGVSAGGDAATVKIKGSKFVPNDLHVKTGTTVTWVNQDPVPHNVVSDDGTLQSPTLEQSDSWAFTFEQPGTFSYICSFHPGMKGSVTVE